MKFYGVFIVIFSIFALSLAGYKTYVSFTHPTKYQTEIISCCKKYDLKDYVVASLINVESSYNKNSKSQKNAIGLMQIKLDTANYLNQLEKSNSINEIELFNPKTNIDYGCKYLRYLLNKFGNINTALAAYNAGETRVRSWLKNSEYSADGITLGNIPYKETDNYVKKIKQNIRFYKKVY